MTDLNRSQKPAVFLDRDGTLIEHVHYLTDPDDVQLVPGAGAALRLLREHGFTCIIITNQSAIGRGMLTEAELDHIHDVLNEQLAAEAAVIDAIYFCPLAPSSKREGDRLAIEHPDRKPGPGLLLQAAEEHDLDLKRSFMVGDMLSDIYAGKNAEVRASILIEGHLSADEMSEHADAIAYSTKSILEAANWICTQVNPQSTIDDNASESIRDNLNVS